MNEVLSEFFVLPLNSPAYYASYNGAIEKSQGELKACLPEKLVTDSPKIEDHSLGIYAEVAAHDLNIGIILASREKPPVKYYSPRRINRYFRDWNGERFMIRCWQGSRGF